jgi:uncharacterized protein with HEPN domain
MIGGWSLKRELDIIEVILGFCEEIELFIQTYGSEIEDFNEKHHLQYGCAFMIQQIGENNKRLSPEFRGRYPEVDWKGAAKMRDILVHQYGSVDVNILRDTVIGDIPILREECRRILKELKKDAS